MPPVIVVILDTFIVEDRRGRGERWHIFNGSNSVCGRKQ